MRNFPIVLIFLLLVAGCKKENKTEWDAEYLAPVASSNLSLENLVKDSLGSVNPDNSVNLRISNTIYELNLGDQLIEIPDTQIGQKVTVDSLILPKSNIDYTTSLGNLAAQLKLSTDPSQQFLGTFILGNHGNTANIPALNGFSAPPFVFDGSAYFQSLEVASGALAFWFVNHLPIPITNVSFEIRNQGISTPIVSGTIPYIPAYDSVYKTYDLAGKTVNSNIEFSITNFNSPGTNGSPVKIDTNDFIRINGVIENIKAKKAIARFPAQDLISSDQEITQKIGDRLFTYLESQTGQLEVNFISSIQEKVRLTYRLKGAYNQNGKGIEAITDIPAAPPGQTQSLQQNYDLSGYSIGLTGSNGSKFNTYTQVIIARIDSTGILRTITSDDSVQIIYKLKNIKPKYIKGYAGSDTIKFAGSSPFNALDIFAGNAPNALDFTQAKLALSIENGLGIDGRARINGLSGTNPNGNQVILQDFSSNPIINRNLTIYKAKDFPFRPAYQQYSVNSSTSNVKDFITNLPNKIDYDIEILTNPQGNKQTYDDFVYFDARLKVNLDLTIPLNVKADNLQLMDTFGFKLGNEPKELDNIKDGVLYLITYNKFPLKANIDLVVYDDNFVAIDTLLKKYVLEPADVDATCKAQVAKKHVYKIEMPTDRIRKIYPATKAIVIAKFNTQSGNGNCSGQHFTFYYDYSLKTKITAQFTYKQKL